MTAAGERDYFEWWGSDAGTTLGQLVDQDVWFRAAPSDENDPLAAMPVFLRITRSEAGKLICTALLIGDDGRSPFPARPITAAILRTIPLPELLAAALDSADFPDSYGASIRAYLAGLPTIAASHPGPRGHSDNHFRDVATAYRAALVSAPRAPTKWLAQQMHVSLPTARRWVQRARDRGFLGASEPGKAGEFGGRQ